MKILVVDDDPSIRALVRSELELAGHDVTVAEDGAQALGRLRADRPDAVVMDVMMPELSGWDLLALLRADPATDALPVVLLTARDLPDDVRRGYELGASAVLSKPYDGDQLCAVLTALHHGLKQELRP